jgi:hypothetical protein
LIISLPLLPLIADIIAIIDIGYAIAFIIFDDAGHISLLIISLLSFSLIFHYFIIDFRLAARFSFIIFSFSAIRCRRHAISLRQIFVELCFRYYVFDIFAFSFFADKLKAFLRQFLFIFGISSPCRFSSFRFLSLSPTDRY